MAITKEGIEKLVVDALQGALGAHDILGPKGEELAKKNQFGENAQCLKTTPSSRLAGGLIDN